MDASPKGQRVLPRWRWSSLVSEARPPLEVVARVLRGVVVEEIPAAPTATTTAAVIPTPITTNTTVRR